MGATVNSQQITKHQQPKSFQRPACTTATLNIEEAHIICMWPIDFVITVCNIIILQIVAIRYYYSIY
jgi:hypothetical protein